jgi:hypothetical protein
VKEVQVMQHVLTHQPRIHVRRRVLIVLAAVAVAVGLTAIVLATRGSTSTSSSVEGSGVGAIVARTVPAFSAVDLAGTNQLTIHVGGRRSVILRGDDNLLPLVATRVEAGTLKISDTRSFTTNARMSAEVTVPSLRAVKLSGTGSVAVDGLRAARLSVALGGSGLVEVGGDTRRVDASLRGTGRIDLGQLVAHDVHAILAGTGEIAVIATRSLEASVTGTGTIAYSGNPRDITRIVTGTGAITPR